MGVKKYTQEVIKEGKRVRWPKKEEFLPALLTVIIICVFCALVLSLWDWAAGSIIKYLKEVFSGINGGGAAETTDSVADAAIRLLGF